MLFAVFFIRIDKKLKKCFNKNELFEKGNKNCYDKKSKIIGTLGMLFVVLFLASPVRIEAKTITYGEGSANPGTFTYDESKYDVYMTEARTYKVYPLEDIKFSWFKKIDTGTVIGRFTLQTALLTSKTYVDDGNGNYLRQQMVYWSVILDPCKIKEYPDYHGTCQRIDVGTNGHAWYYSDKKNGDLMTQMYMFPTSNSSTPNNIDVGYSFSGTTGNSLTEKGGAINTTINSTVSGKITFTQNAVSIQSILNANDTTWKIDYIAPKTEDQDRINYMTGESCQMGIKGWYIPEYVSYSDSEKVQTDYVKNCIVQGLTISATVSFGIAKTTPSGTYYNLFLSDKGRKSGYDYQDIGIKTKAHMVYKGNGIYDPNTKKYLRPID